MNTSEWVATDTSLRTKISGLVSSNYALFDSRDNVDGFFNKLENGNIMCINAYGVNGSTKMLLNGDCGSGPDQLTLASFDEVLSSEAYSSEYGYNFGNTRLVLFHSSESAKNPVVIGEDNQEYETGAKSNAETLYEYGVKSSIGFRETINHNRENTYMNAFFDSLGSGRTVFQACVDARNAYYNYTQNISYGGYDSYVIFGATNQVLSQ